MNIKIIVDEISKSISEVFNKEKAIEVDNYYKCSIFLAITKEGRMIYLKVNNPEKFTFPSIEDELKKEED